jgi:hypothetical protein
MDCSAAEQKRQCLAKIELPHHLAPSRLDMQRNSHTSVSLTVSRDVAQCPQCLLKHILI